MLGACLLFLSVTVCQAQDNFQPGYAILNDGTRINGQINFYTNEPWLNQRFIWLKDSASIASTGADRAKPKRYRIDEIQSYQAGQHTYEKVHYADLEKIQFKTLGANEHLLERLSAGKINSYRYYSYPKDIDIYVGTNSQEVNRRVKQEKDDLLASWKFLARKGTDDKFRNAFDYDIQKYFEDTPEVLQKYQNGGYGNEPVSAKKGLAARMVAMAKQKALMPLQYEAIAAAFNDYNLKNTSK